MQDYGERLPHPSNNSFLLFAKGARKEGRPLHKIGGLIPAQLQKIESWDKSSRGNHGGPTKSQLMLARDGQTVYYWSAQVTSAPCVCRSGFGAGAHLKHVPASSALWNACTAILRSCGTRLCCGTIRSELREQRVATSVAGEAVADIVELEGPQTKQWRCASC